MARNVIIDSPEDFRQWLDAERIARDMSYREVSGAGGFSSSMFPHINHRGGNTTLFTFLALVKGLGYQVRIEYVPPE
jgi:hypothetical protein